MIFGWHYFLLSLPPYDAKKMPNDETGKKQKGAKAKKVRPLLL
jgi:hypothetical protein